MDRSSLNANAMWRGAARPATGQLLISEVFGPTLQGEGPSAGQPAVFVRLGACNLSCTWCDTAYTWDRDRYDLSHELVVRPTEDVAAEVLSLDPRLVVLTGGEPALQLAEAERLALMIAAVGVRIEVETNGTMPLGELASVAGLLVISPKLANAGHKASGRLRWDVLTVLSQLPNAVFKFVVTGEQDLLEVDAIASRLSLRPSRVWVMPEATEPMILLQKMADLANPLAKRGWSLSPRLQVLLWANERGH
jgi:7-carboxy-7-deazaguanine synthase